MKRIGQVVGAVLLLLGAFWAGRESSHGLAALWEHWWCAIPLAMIVLGVTGLITANRLRPAA